MIGQYTDEQLYAYLKTLGLPIPKNVSKILSTPLKIANTTSEDNKIANKVLLEEKTFPYQPNFKLVLEYDCSISDDKQYYDVTFYLYFQSINGWAGSGSPAVGRINNIEIGSTTILSQNQKLLIGTKTVQVRPDENGDFSTIYSASITCYWGCGNASVSGTLGLPKLSRASTWAYNSTNNMSTIEGNLVLKINQYDSSYTNKVTVSNLNMKNIVRTMDNVKNNDVLKFTDEELKKVYVLETNSNIQDLRFFLNLYTYDSEGNQVGEVQRCMQMVTITDAEPTFTYTIEETNQKVADVFGNNKAQSLVKLASNPKVTINAVGKKGATIKLVSITNGTQANANENPYTFNDVQSGVFTVTITDSREFTTQQTINIPLLDYVPININSYEFKRVSQTSSNILLTADITCFSGSFNSKTNNPTIMFKVGSSGSLQQIKTGYTFSNNKVTFKNYDMGELISYQNENTIYLYVLDLFTEDTENYKILKGIATFDAGEHDFQVNGDLFVADQNRENKINVLGEIKKRYINEYSTMPVVVGSWLDKPLYQKVIPFNFSSSSNNISIAHKIENLDDVIFAHAKFTDSNGNMRRFVPQFYNDMSPNYSITIYNISDTNVNIYYGNWAKDNANNLEKCYVILLYTLKEG